MGKINFLLGEEAERRKKRERERERELRTLPGKIEYVEKIFIYILYIYALTILMSTCTHIEIRQNNFKIG